MPSYYPPGTRKGNRTYIVRGRIDGRAYEQITGATDKSGAEEFWYALRRDVRQGAVARDRETATFDDAVRLYQAARYLSRGEQKRVDRLRHHFRSRHLSEMRPADLIEAAHDLYPNTLPQTKNRACIEPAAAILHYAAKNNLCDWMRAQKLPVTEPERKLVYPDELEPVIKAATGPLRVILVTLAYQGWRITETLQVRRDKFDPDNARVQRWVSKSRTWKWTPLDPEVCRLWQMLPERADGFIFPYRDRHNFYRVLRPVLESLGVEYTPHMSRRGFATALLEAGENLEAIKVAGGWEDLRSVALYSHVDIEQARRTIGKLRGRMRGRSRKRLA